MGDIAHNPNVAHKCTTYNNPYLVLTRSAAVSARPQAVAVHNSDTAELARWIASLRSRRPTLVSLVALALHAIQTETYKVVHLWAT